MEYKAEDFISFIENDRRDKVSYNGLELIAKRFRELECEVNKLSLGDVSGSSLDWIEKDKIAGECLTKFLKDEPETSPLYDISGKLLRRLIIEGINAGLNYR